VLEFTLNRPGDSLGEDDSYQGSLGGVVPAVPLVRSLENLGPQTFAQNSCLKLVDCSEARAAGSQDR